MTASIDQLRQGRRAAAESAPPAVADDFPQPSRRARRRAAEEAEAARQRAETGPGETGGRRALPEPERARRADERRRTYRDPGSESRGWTIPDEPWRGTEVPWRGPDGEYHTGSIPLVTDDEEPGGPRRPDLTVIPGGADVREYESNYEGRDVAPLVPETPYDDDRPGPEPGWVPPQQQPRSRHLKAVPGEPYGR